MAGIKQDTADVKREFEAISTPTQVFIWTLVALGVVIGVLIGAFAVVGIAIETVDGQDCIDLDDVQYCAQEEPETAEG